MINIDTYMLITKRITFSAMYITKFIGTYNSIFEIIEQYSNQPYFNKNVDINKKRKIILLSLIEWNCMLKNH